MICFYFPTGKSLLILAFDVICTLQCEYILQWTFFPFYLQPLIAKRNEASQKAFYMIKRENDSLKLRL